MPFYMITAFCTSFPDWLMVICLLLIACVILFKLLIFVAALLAVIFNMLKYALTGRWKEYWKECDTDSESIR